MLTDRDQPHTGDIVLVHAAAPPLPQQAIEDETLIPRAKADLAARTRDHPYVCPIPTDVKPPLDMSAA